MASSAPKINPKKRKEDPIDQNAEKQPSKRPQKSDPIPIPVAKKRAFRAHGQESEAAKKLAAALGEKQSTSYASLENDAGEIEKYIKHKTLGNGNKFRTRMFATHEKDSKQVKKIAIANNLEKQSLDAINERLGAIKLCSTLAMVTEIEAGYWWIASDFVPGFQMRDLFGDEKSFDDEAKQSIELSAAIFVKCVTAVLYSLIEIHVKNIMHGDLNLTNILINIFSQPEKNVAHEKRVFQANLIDYERARSFGETFYFAHDNISLHYFKSPDSIYYNEEVEYAIRIASASQDLYNFAACVEYYLTRISKIFSNTQIQEIKQIFNEMKTNDSLKTHEHFHAFMLLLAKTYGIDFLAHESQHQPYINLMKTVFNGNDKETLKYLTGISTQLNPNLFAKIKVQFDSKATQPPSTPLTAKNDATPKKESQEKQHTTPKAPGK